MNEIIKIILVDDHELIREGLKSFLENNIEIKIVGEASNGKQLIKKYFEVKPDVSIIDITMPGIDGFETAEIIRGMDSKAKILFQTAHEDIEYIYYAIKVGCSGFITKANLVAEIFKAIKIIKQGGYYFESNYTKEGIDNFIKHYEDGIILKDEYNFTLTELKHLKLYSEGKTAKEIAAQLFITEDCVNFHRKNLMHKICVKCTNALIVFAVKYFIKHKYVRV